MAVYDVALARKVIKEHYADEGGLFCSKLIEGMSKKQVQSMASSMGINLSREGLKKSTIAKQSAWTAKERGIMETVYKLQGLAATLKELPGRTDNQVIGYACRNGIKVSPEARKRNKQESMRNRFKRERTAAIKVPCKKSDKLSAIERLALCGVWNKSFVRELHEGLL